MNWNHQSSKLSRSSSSVSFLGGSIFATDMVGGGGFLDHNPNSTGETGDNWGYGAENSSVVWR